MNYLSRPTPVVEPTNMMNVIAIGANTADTLQQRYDSNKAIVDQTLAQYESLRGLSDEDNAYIASQVSNIKNQVNQLGGLNLAHNTGRDSILNNLKNVLKDPIVQNILISKNNKDALDAEFQKVKDKDPSKASKENYEFALYQGGYQDYLQGKTKKVSSMSYKPYEDVSGNVSKRLKEYVDQYDDEQYLGDKETQFQTISMFGKKILKRDLETFISTTTTPSEYEQLNINTWSKYKNATDEDVSKLLKPVYDREAKSIEEDIAALKAKADTGVKGAKEALRIKSEELSAVKSKTAFTKSDLYQYETSRFISNMASLYDKDIITKIDKDNLKFDVYKFGVETNLKLKDLELKAEANRLKSQENDLTKQSMGGDIVVRETPEEEQTLTDVQKRQKDLGQSASALEQYLVANNAEFKQMNPAARFNYMIHFNPADLTVKGNKNTALVLANAFQNSQKAYHEMTATAEASVANTVKESYNSMIGGSVKLENLKHTMPLTAKLLQSNKGVNFESLHNSEKKGLIAEWTANKLQYAPPDSEDTKAIYRAIVVKNKAELSKIKSDVARNTLETIKNTADNEEAAIFTPLISSGVSMIKNRVLDNIYESFGGLKNTIMYGKDYADQEYNRARELDKKEHQATVTANDRSFIRGMRDRFFVEDTNITELEPRDLGIKNGKVSRDIESAFKSLDDDVKINIQKVASDYEANIKEYSAFNFSTSSKEQKATAQKLRAAVIDVIGEGGTAPETTNDYTVSREGTSFRVDYTGEKGVRKSVLVPKLDPSVLQGIDDRKADWLKDPKNRKIALRPMVFEPITSPKESQEKVEAFVENIEDSGLYPPEFLDSMRANPSNTPLASATDLIQKVKQQHGVEFYNKNKTKIDEILYSNYTAIPYSTGNAFKVRIDYKEDGRDFSIHSPGDGIPQKDDAALFVMQINTLDYLKNQRIKELK